MNLEIFETNSALGFNQLAYLLKTKEAFLVIGTKNCTNDNYKIGELVNIDKNLIQKSNFKIENSPLRDYFLFKYFLKNEGLKNA